MAQRLDVRHLSDARLLCNIVASLNPLAGFAGVPAALGQIGGGPFSSMLYPRTPPLPSWLWIDTGNQVIVASSGVLRLEDGLGVFASSLQPLVSVGPFSAGAGAVGAARTMLTALGPRSANSSRSFVLAGHSYGGAIMEVLAGLLLNSRAASDVQVVTFGSPRPGDSTLRDYLALATVRRYMNTGDPVPRFPPHLNEAPALCLLAGYTLTAIWARYVQPNGGVVMDSAGGLVVGPLPTGVLPITDLQLLGWALSDRGFLATSHAVAQYQLRLAIAAGGSEPVTSNPLPGSQPESELVPTVDQFNDALRGGAVVPSQPEGRTMAQGYIPTIFRAKAVRRADGSYAVMWINQDVMIGHNRSNARALAAALNKYLRTMQGAASVDHTAFNNMLANYWTVCTEATNGFIPPLVVT